MVPECRVVLPGAVHVGRDPQPEVARELEDLAINPSIAELVRQEYPGLFCRGAAGQGGQSEHPHEGGLVLHSVFPQTPERNHSWDSCIAVHILK